MPVPTDHPLIAAAAAGDLGRVTELLAADPDLVDVRGWMGITPLIAATWRADSAEVVRHLLAHGADPHAARTNGDNALHWAASGPVAEALATAAPAALTARYLFDETPLHIAASEGRADVVRAFLAAGADPGAVSSRGETPLDQADDPATALLLVDAGAPPGMALHDACRRAARDPGWLAVADRLLDHRADPGVRDRFGALPSDLLADGPLRDRMTGMVLASGRTVELTVAEAAAGAQSWVVLDPTGTTAVTGMYSDTVLVHWRLGPSVEPVEVIRLDRRRARSPLDTMPEELLPDEPYPGMVRSPDGRHLLVPSCEELRLIDPARQAVVADVGGFGDWSVVPRFSPDGRTVAVGNSMQGTWWLTVLDVTDDGLTPRHERHGLPSNGGPEIVSDVAFAPDGRTVATWVRPDHGQPGGRGLVAVTDVTSGAVAWHHTVDGGTPFSASLCFSPDGAALAVGLDSGVRWLDAATGVPLGEDHAVGRVNGLAAHPAAGVLAATARGLRRAGRNRSR